MNWKLVVDVGGTNVRFSKAWAADRLDDAVRFKLTQFDDFMPALENYLSGIEDLASCTGGAVAVAGQGSADEIKLTNANWSIRRDEISRAINGAPVTLYNDLEAAAYSIPHLHDEHLVNILNPQAKPSPTSTRIAINMGTGFGACPIVHADGRWVSLPGEAGHMTLAAHTDDEYALVNSTTHTFDGVEDVLAGAGLRRLYAHLANISEEVAPPSDQIFALSETSDIGRDCIRIYENLLGRVCGDLTVASGVRGGVYLFGSVAHGWHGYGSVDTFARNFQAKGKMTGNMKVIPVYRVILENAPLVGLAAQLHRG